MSETSVSQSRPLELYRFEGSFKTYLYTSGDKAVTAATGPGGAIERYVPVTIERSEIKLGTHEDDSLSTEFTLPHDVPVVLDYAFAQTPPRLSLVIYRKQHGSPAVAASWRGEVRGFNIDGRKAKVQVPSMFSMLLSGELTNVYYQSTCNHCIYDKRCGVKVEDHRQTTTIAGVSGPTITLNASTGTAGDYAAGEIVNTRNGERRMIRSNTGQTVTVGIAFVDLAPGDVVYLHKGCDRSLDTCQTKFNNVINFGGFPYIPAENPFEGEL